MQDFKAEGAYWPLEYFGKTECMKGPYINSNWPLYFSYRYRSLATLRKE